MFSSLTSSLSEGIKRLSLDTLQEEQQQETKEGEGDQVLSNAGGNHESPRERVTFGAVLPPVLEESLAACSVDTPRDEWDWEEKESETAPKPALRFQKAALERLNSERNGALRMGESVSQASSIDSYDTLKLTTNEATVAREVTPEGSGGHIFQVGDVERFQKPNRLEDGDCADDGPGEVAKVAGPQVAIGGYGMEKSDVQNVAKEPATMIVSTLTARQVSMQRHAGGDSPPTSGNSPPVGRELDVDCSLMVEASEGDASDVAVEASVFAGENEVETIDDVGDCGYIMDQVMECVQDADETQKFSRDPGLVLRETPGDSRSEETTSSLYAAEEVQGPRSSYGDRDALVAMKNELAAAKSLTSTLEEDLHKSRSQVIDLQQSLAMVVETERKDTRQWASLRNELQAAKMGFRESNEAHQRTAERNQACEEELRKAKEALDNLKTEKLALLEQVRLSTEDRQGLETQLQQAHVEMQEGQEAARQESRKEVEELEGRIKDLLKDKDRKQTELELQNARRKETREMARDLESQLAAVERIAQEREVELNDSKEKNAALRREADEARDKQTTYATKYEALERNFKQVRAQGKHVDSELEEFRETVARIEAEKVALAEKAEEEAAERVTLVSSISHERDFLLRQVDRLEQELAEVHQAQQAEVAAAEMRAQASGHLEEYRTRAQEALKRANEITSQTTSENTSLKEKIADLTAEVARERPLWEKWKDTESVLRQEVAELAEKLESATKLRDSAATELESIQSRLAEGQEESRDTHAAFTRLEAQVKSLKQELQRHQKALIVYNEREAALQEQLAEKDTALMAAEDRGRHKPVSPMEGKSDDSLPLSPTSANPAKSAEWEDQKESGKTRSEVEAPDVVWRDIQQSMGESFRSFSTEGESADAGSMAEQLVYVQQLRERMSKEQQQMRSMISELEASRSARDAQDTKQAQLEKRLEAALLANKRLQQLESGRNAAINLEYLKNCVVGCLRTSEPSEHARLLPVITTILKLSQEEEALIARNISTRAKSEGSFGGGLAPPSNGKGWWNGKQSGR